MLISIVFTVFVTILSHFSIHQKLKQQTHFFFLNQKSSVSVPTAAEHQLKWAVNCQVGVQRKWSGMFIQRTQPSSTELCLLNVCVCVAIFHQQHHRIAFCEASPNQFLNFRVRNKYWTKRESLKVKCDRLSTNSYAVVISEYFYECNECIINKCEWNENL